MGCCSSSNRSETEKLINEHEKHNVLVKSNIINENEKHNVLVKSNTTNENEKHPVLLRKSNTTNEDEKHNELGGKSNTTNEDEKHNELGGKSNTTNEDEKHNVLVRKSNTTIDSLIQNTTNHIDSLQNTTKQTFYHRIGDIDTDSIFNPIQGLTDSPDLTLPEAIQYAQNIDNEFAKIDFSMNLATAEYFANNLEETVLSMDEVMIIHLYTQESPFYRTLNSKLRNRDRNILKPFFPLLKMLVTALNKLPPINKTVYRGVKLNLKEKYQNKQGKSEIWWSFGSTTDSIQVLTDDMFLGDKGERTMFVISTQTVRDISRYSAVSLEKELILLPGTVFIVESVLPQQELTIIQLTEKIDPRMSILPPISNSVADKGPEKDNVQNQNTLPKNTNPPEIVKQPIEIVQVVPWGENFECDSCLRKFVYQPDREYYRLGTYAKSQSITWGGYISYKNNPHSGSRFKLGDVIECYYCSQKLQFKEVERINDNNRNNCPKGHALEQRMKTTGAYMCDICRKSLGSLSKRGCKVCDYDICDECYNK